MKAHLIFLLFSTSISAKIFQGKCPIDEFAGYSECVNKDTILSSQSDDSRYHQVIAWMEYEQAHGITMFYSLYKQNLVALIQVKEKQFAITCWSMVESPLSNYFTFNFKFDEREKCNAANSSFYVSRRSLDLKKFTDTRKSLIYVTKQNEYLVFWGCSTIDEHSYDLAAWVLFSNSSLFVQETKELHLHFGIFLKSLENTSLNLTFKNFRVNELFFNSKSCILETKVILSTVKQDIENMRARNLSRHYSKSKWKFFGMIIFLIALAVLVGIYSILSSFLFNRCRVSALLNIL